MSVIVGQSPYLESELGYAEATRAVMKMLIDGLQDQLDMEKARWDQADLAWQTMIGSGPGEIDLPSVPLDHFHEGPHQSLLLNPIDFFPAVSAMCYYSQPSLDKPDQLESVSLRLFIECFQISGPISDDPAVMVEHETIVHRRIERLTEAVNKVIMRDKTLCGTVHPGISALPRGGIGGQSFVRREEKSRGPKWLWQGSRLEYSLQRHSMF